MPSLPNRRGYASVGWNRLNRGFKLVFEIDLKLGENFWEDFSL